MMKSILYAAVLAFPVAANAAGVKPGLYVLNSTQEICLAADGTWTSPTQANWGGQWVITGSETHIFGNYASGAGNDSIVVKGKGGSWTEWKDDLSFSNILDPITFTKAGACTDSGKAVLGNAGNPSQAKPLRAP